MPCLLGVDHDGGDRCRTGQQRNGQRHDSDAGPGVGAAGAVVDIVGTRFRGLGVQHLDGAHEQQQTSANLEGRQRDTEELQDLQAEQRADGNHQERRDCSGARCLPALRRGEVAGEVNEERDDADWIDDGQQGDQGFYRKVHGMLRVIRRMGSLHLDDVDLIESGRLLSCELDCFARNRRWKYASFAYPTMKK